MDKINGIATLVSMGLNTGTILVTGIVGAIHMFAGLFGHTLTDAEMTDILNHDLVDAARREALAREQAKS